MGKHAERRIEWAEESFNNGATQKAENYLNEYVQVKKEVSAKLDQVDEKIVNDFKNRTIVENRKIDEFKNDISETSPVIVEETRANEYDPEALTKLHLSIGVNHAMIEDPMLFLPLGIPPFWLWIPRLIAAVAVTYLFSALLFARRLYAKRACHKKIRNN